MTVVCMLSISVERGRKKKSFYVSNRTTHHRQTQHQYLSTVALLLHTENGVGGETEMIYLCSQHHCFPASPLCTRTRISTHTRHNAIVITSKNFTILFCEFLIFLFLSFHHCLHCTCSIGCFFFFFFLSAGFILWGFAVSVFFFLLLVDFVGEG